MFQVVLLIGAFFASSLSAGGSWRDQHPQQRQLSYKPSLLERGFVGPNRLKQNIVGPSRLERNVTRPSPASLRTIRPRNVASFVFYVVQW
uniref:Secreted protein n=1 Tax=Ascaris lumbricoides TaxID=6252 RepID=A0A0M3I412_ASCLU